MFKLKVILCAQILCLTSINPERVSFLSKYRSTPASVKTWCGSSHQVNISLLLRVDVYFSARWHQEIKGCTMGSCFVRPEEFPSSAEIRPPPPPLPPLKPGALNTSDGERLWSDGASLNLSRASLHHSTGRLFPASLLAWL